MSHIDLTGKVAIVTGGGRGIGRAHCRLLASRGAAVVVNDPGVEPGGKAPDASVAAGVVSEIETDGGRAVASSESMATVDGGQAIVATALNTFGRIDLLVHNAGNMKFGTFADQSMEDAVDLVTVHLLGAWYVGQPAWRHMVERGSGRFVFTSSVASFGHFNHPAYAAARQVSSDSSSHSHGRRVRRSSTSRSTPYRRSQARGTRADRPRRCGETSSRPRTSQRQSPFS